MSYMSLDTFESCYAWIKATDVQVFERNFHWVGEDIVCKYARGLIRQNIQQIYINIANQGFPNNVSPTIRPSAPVCSRLFERSSKTRTLPLLIMGMVSRSDCFSFLTSDKSAAPCLRRLAEVVRACKVIQDEPDACSRSANSTVLEDG